MKTIIFFLLIFSAPVIMGCGGSVLSAGKNIRGDVLYKNSGDSVGSGIAIFDNGTDSYRVEISNGRFEVGLPAGSYKVWFENIEPFPIQANYLSLEKTPIEVTVLGKQQMMSLLVYQDTTTKKGK